MSQTQKPLLHTSGGEKQLFPSKNSNLFYTAKKKVPQKKLPAQRGLDVQKESQRTGSCHGLVLFSAKVLYFMQRKLQSFPGPAKLEETQVGLVQQLWIPPKLSSLDSGSEKWEQREGKRKDEWHKAVHKSFFSRAGHKNTSICFSMK